MRIEELTETTTDGVVELWRDAGLVRAWNDPVIDLRRALDGPASSVLGAFVDERLVGSVMVGHDGHRGWVYYLAVAAGSRRRGVGGALMKASEDWLSDRSIPKLNLMVRTGNEPAMSFYERVGYARDDVVVLSRRLESKNSTG